MTTRSDDLSVIDDDTGEIPTTVLAVDQTDVVTEEPSAASAEAAPAPQRSGRKWQSHRRARTASLTTVTVVATLIGVSLLAVWFILYAFVFSSVQEHRSQQQNYDEFRGLLDSTSSVASPIGGVIKPGTPIAVLQTRDGTFDDLVVVEGTASGDLAAGPGHLRNSPLPGQAGTAVVLGRSVTSGAPFKSVTALQPGTVITVTTAQGVFPYKVDGVRRAGDLLPAPLAANASRLTLVTSDGSGWRSALAPGDTVWVDATLQGQTVAAPPGRVVAVPSAELPNHGDPAAWLLLIFWLQALILVGVGFTWAWFRWGRWQTYVVGTPVIVAVLWGTSETAMRLLPNLL